MIGLSGGIASGKTSICNRLKGLGARIISCDHLGHAAYQKGTKCYHEMVEYFGNSILNDEQEIDRKKLGPIVFSDKVNHRSSILISSSFYLKYPVFLIFLGAFE